MAGITFTHKGKFEKTYKFFDRALKANYRAILEKYGKEGVDALSSATPVRTGLTASSWGYEITTKGNTATITWTNSNTNHGVNIAVLLQYGHGTRNGGYVRGIDYINPTIQPIFKRMADEAWKEVTE